MRHICNSKHVTIWVIAFLLCAHIVHGQHYISIYLENGDHFKGRWLGGDEKSIQMEVYDQQLSIPLREVVYITAFDDSRTIPGEAAEKHFLNGQTFLQLEMYDSAKASFMKAIEEFPKYPDAHYQLARLFEAEGNIDEALKYFGHVVKINPNAYSMEAKFKQAGDTYLAAEEYRKAVNVYLLLFRIYPDRYGVEEAAYTAGFLLAEELNESQEALKVLQEAVAYFPDSDEYLERASYLIGSLLSSLGDADMAVEALTDFIQNYPQSRWLANAYMARGNAYMQLRQNTDATADYNSVSSYTSNLKLKNEARKKISESVWTIYTVSDGLPSNQIQAIAVDGQTLWIGTPKGLAQIDFSTGTWQLVTDVTDHINTLFDEEKPIDVRTIAVDNQELWIGTLNHGVIRYSKGSTFPEIFDRRKGLPDNTVYSIKMDKAEVWIGTFAGVASYQRSTGEWKHYSRKDGLPADDIVALAVTPDRIWIGTSQNGIGVYNRTMEIWQSFGASDNLDLKAGSEIVSFDVSTDKVFFTWNYSLDKANGYGEIGQSDLSSTVETVLRFVDMVPYQSIYVAAGSTTLWIATNGGIWIKTGEGWRDPVDFPSSRINTPIVSCIDLGVGAAWIGTADGVAKIDTSAIYGSY